MNKSRSVWMLVSLAISFATLSMLVTFFMGKDDNADLVNYHFYSAHALVTGQFRSDFMGAGAQSYLNPLGYVPFYWLVKSGLSSFLISAIYAAFHSLNMLMLWCIGHRFLFARSARRTFLSILGALLGSLSPVFIAMLGGTFLDPVLSVFILGALYTFLNGVEESTQWSKSIFVAGLLLGAATGLKLAAAPYCIAAAVCVLISSGAKEILARRILALSAGGIAGLALTGGWWGWQMASEFGNPFFPVLNGVFKSPDFPAINISHDRFLPHGLLDYLLLPFRMMKLNSGVYVEIVAPDLRLFLVQIALATFLVLAAIRRLRLADVLSEELRPLWIVLTFAIVGWLLNQAVSGNGRYAITSLLLAGPILAALATHLAPSEKQAWAAVVAILALQFAHGFTANYPRWDTAPWTTQWFSTRIPEKLSRNAYGYVWLNTSNPSAIIPFLAPGSGSISLHGYEPLDPQGPGSAKAKQFLTLHQGRLKLLIRSDDGDASENVEQGRLSNTLTVTANRLLEPWNLRVEPGQCEYLTLSSNIGVAKDSKTSQGTREINGYLLAACSLANGAVSEPGLLEERRLVTAAFNNVSAACPLLYPPPAGYPYKYGTAWVKRFAGTDTILAVLDDRMISSKYPFGPFNLELGSVRKWAENPQAIACKRHPRPW